MTIHITRLTGDGYFAEIGERNGVAINPETDELPSGCQYVLLTHWSETLWKTAKAIAQQCNAIVVVAADLAEQLENLYKNSLPAHIMPVAIDQEIELPWGTLMPVACAHEYFFPNDPAPYTARGFVLSAEGHYVYYAGPTAMSPGLRDVGKLYKPDVALLPVGETFLQNEELCQAVMWLGSDIILPFIKTGGDAEAVAAEAYSMIDIYSPAICRFLNEGDAYILAPVEATGRTAGPEARY